MSREVSLQTDNDLFSSKLVDDIAVIYLKPCQLIHSTILTEKEKLLDFLDVISDAPRVKAAVVVGSAEKLGCREYHEFFELYRKGEIDRNHIMRMFHACDQLMMRIVHSSKIFISADQGEIITQFMDLSFACDYRIVADNGTFINPCIEYGLVPKGGGAFFLPQMIGVAQTYELLLSDEPLPATKALELGLVQKTVPQDKLEEEALNVAKMFLSRPAHTLKALKKLINHSRKGLHDYLEFENSVLLNLLFRQ